jgi:hypothetical protein
MVTVSVFKRKLSGSTDGKPIKVAAVATAGTAIHTAQAGTTEGNYDEIWLYAFNSHTAAMVLTIEFGGASAPDQNIVQTLDPRSGLVLVVPGLILQNAATVKAFASAANVVTISGWVNMITEA